MLLGYMYVVNCQTFSLKTCTIASYASMYSYCLIATVDSVSESFYYKVIARVILLLHITI